MKNKGYTLIELLGVIIIISVLLTIVFPSIINFIKNSTNEQDKLVKELIYNASEEYIEEYYTGFPQKEGNRISIDISSLVESGNLTNDLQLSNTDDINNKCVQAIYKNNKFSYELKDKGNCETKEFFVCEPVNEKTVTTGNIPFESVSLGDEYICEVKDGVKHRFFVIETAEDKVALIMERNICADGSVATAKNNCLVGWSDSASSNSKGPVTAMAYLHNATKNWDNIPNIIINYTDEGNTKNYGYGSIITTGSTTKITNKAGSSTTATFENLKTRLPKYSEMKTAGNCTSTAGTCTLWAANYLLTFSHSYYLESEGKVNLDDIYGYWTLSSVATHTSRAWNVYALGRVYYHDSNTVTYNGVRPVIEMNKNDVPTNTCRLVSGEVNEIGSKYKCEVKEGTIYNFFVLSHNDDGTTNLIMEKNIYYDKNTDTSAEADSTNTGRVAWYSLSQSNAYGPVTAMNYLHNATKDWDNIPNIVMNYTDEEKSESYGYGNIKTRGITTNITQKDKVTVTATYKNLKSRLPEHSEVYGTNKCLKYGENGINYGSCPIWLANYLNDSSKAMTGEGIQDISDIYGYWTLSSYNDSINAQTIFSYAYSSYANVDNLYTYGVRPVITLKL